MSLSVPNNDASVCLGVCVCARVGGLPDDYDTWARLGCAGWSYQEVLPFFLRSERSQVADAEPGYHGRDGPMGTRTLRPGQVHAELFVEAGRQAGFPVAQDYNGSSQFGFGYTQVRTHIHAHTRIQTHKCTHAHTHTLKQTCRY
jgi:choline dehydrogenase-like flavoprotein